LRIIEPHSARSYETFARDFLQAFAAAGSGNTESALA
jgi:hypothetical protein